MTKDEEPTAGAEVLAARHDVELARADLELRLRDVGLAGRRVWTRMGRRARPFLIGGAIAVGALVLVRVLRPGSRARTGDWRPPRAPSLLRVAIGAALGILMRSATTALVRHAAERLEPARLERNDP
jgi:hypothetical protein